MAQQTINVGASPNDGTGTPLRTAFQYTNSNFSELYTAVGPSGNNIVVPGNATISGDLTVDTSTLKVDSANDAVGIGTTSPTTYGAKLAVIGSGNGILAVGQATSYSTLQSNGQDFYLNMKGTGSTIFRLGSGDTEAMRLNSTGLGVGVSPSVRLHASAAAPTRGVVSKVQNSSSGTTGAYLAIAAVGANVWSLGLPAGSADLAIFSGRDESADGTERLRIDSSGNVVIGATTAIGKLRVRNGSGQNFVVDVSTANQVSLQNYGSTGDGGFQELNLWGSPVTITTGTAGGTSGTERIRVKSGGQMRFVPLAADPAGAEAGDVYYNSSSNKLKCYNGTTWNDLF